MALFAPEELFHGRASLRATMPWKRDTVSLCRQRRTSLKAGGDSSAFAVFGSGVS